MQRVPRTFVPAANYNSLLVSTKEEVNIRPEQFHVLQGIISPLPRYYVKVLLLLLQGTQYVVGE